MAQRPDQVEIEKTQDASQIHENKPFACTGPSVNRTVVIINQKSEIRNQTFPSRPPETQRVGVEGGLAGDVVVGRRA